MSDSYSSNDNSSYSEYWSSSDVLPTWYWTEAGRERAQEQAIEQQRARTRRLERERRAAEAELAERISSTASLMNSRLDTVIQWTELRFQQLEFDEYQARKEIRNTVRALAEGRDPVLHGFDDVPGYWLPPAAAAVLPLVLRDRVPQQRTAGNSFADLKTGLEAARERDAVRAELFSLAVGRCFDQPAFIDAAVLRLLTEPSDLGVAEPGQVAAGWRTLWEQAALGAFGPSAEAQIASLLRERFDAQSLDEAALASWDTAIADFGATEARRLTPAEAYEALAAHFAAEPDAPALPADEASLSASAYGEVSAPSGPAPDAAWRSYLQELIEEPSPAELPLVLRMAEFNPLPERREGDRRSWTAPAGTVADLVRRDLFDPETPVPLRRLALDLAAPVLRSRLDHREASLGTTEKVTVNVRRRGETIGVTRDGHDPEQFAAVERRIDAAFAAVAPSTAVTASFVAGIGAFAVLMLVLGQWFLAALCAAAAVIPLWKHRTDAAKAAQQNVRRDDQLADVRAALLKARKDAELEERTETERDIATRQALKRLRSALPAEPRPNVLSESR
ncbi:hypothetical protein [Glycomyces rhizosphaerae]|uniref:Uncharacterized protein n=1 Tax=Glycomyces rhizosphaerae TaxID=2054422 RepID=A0ABV7PV07_9ACTN